MMYSLSAVFCRGALRAQSFEYPDHFRKRKGPAWSHPHKTFTPDRQKGSVVHSYEDSSYASGSFPTARVPGTVRMRYPLPLMHVRHDIDFLGLAQCVCFCFCSVVRPYSAYNSGFQGKSPRHDTARFLPQNDADFSESSINAKPNLLLRRPKYQKSLFPLIFSWIDTWKNAPHHGAPCKIFLKCH